MLSQEVIDPQENKRNVVYFVCTGNTCRSPMAAAMFKHALNSEDEPYRSLTVDSFGIAAQPGVPASENTIFVLSKVGIPLENHASKNSSQADIDHALAFVCMTKSHADAIALYLNIAPERIILMREALGEPSVDIPDPFGGGVDEYYATQDSMLEAIPSLVRVIKERWDRETAA